MLSILLLAANVSLVSAKAAIMNADYRGDLAKLAAVRAELAPLRDDPEVGYLADYWSGYASHRIAINGANGGMSPADMKVHLDRAAADYESSFRKKPDFADAIAGAALVHGWLAYPAFHPDDPGAAKVHLESGARLQKKAEELEPSNPRVMWVKGAFYLYSPPESGGSREKAMEIYRKQAEVSGPPQPDSPLPDWGKAEALMSLAFAHTMGNAPDLEAAMRDAHAALKVQPEWRYVREVLVPMIEKRRATP